MTDAPLTGIRVLDLTNVLAGPYCTYQLGLLGAEVIKVEVPDKGDLARQLGPDPALNAAGTGASFLAQNSGKKSVELDLKSDDGKAAFTALVSKADVLVENFRPGVLGRLGFPWGRLRQINPALVYCAISGFGQTGPMSMRPAYDQIIQGLSGMMSITGTAETAPLRIGFPICDTIGGLMAAMNINAALVKREHTGVGCAIDLSMLEASISAMGWAVSNYLITGVRAEPMGDQNATAAPSGTFEAADGPLNIAANQQRQFVTLCELVGRPDLVGDPRFHEREARKIHRSELNVELNRALSARPAAEWEERLSAAGVPAARILTVEQAVELEQLRIREFFADVAMPGHTDGRVRTSGSGAWFDGRPFHPAARAPHLGEHTAELLGEHSVPLPHNGTKDQATTP